MSKVTKKDLNERLLMVETLLGLHRVLPEQISNDQANNAIFRMQCALSSGKEIAGRNPTEVEQRIEALEEFATYADNMLTELNHALPDTTKEKLKALDQSVFDGLEENWRFAAVDGCTGRAYVYEQKPHFFHGKDYWRIHEGLQRIIGHDYDTSNWQNSLIERDKVELTGSDLARAMLARGDKFVLCFVHEFGDDRAVEDKASVAINFVNEHGFQTDSNQYNNAVPINNQGEPLTAAEAGL